MIGKGAVVGPWYEAENPYEEGGHLGAGDEIGGAVQGVVRRVAPLGDAIHPNRHDVVLVHRVLYVGEDGYQKRSRQGLDATVGILQIQGEGEGPTGEVLVGDRIAAASHGQHGGLWSGAVTPVDGDRVDVGCAGVVEVAADVDGLPGVEFDGGGAAVVLDEEADERATRAAVEVMGGRHVVVVADGAGRLGGAHHSVGFPGQAYEERLRRLVGAVVENVDGDGLRGLTRGEGQHAGFGDVVAGGGGAVGRRVIDGHRLPGGGEQCHREREDGRRRGVGAFGPVGVGR